MTLRLFALGGLGVLAISLSACSHKTAIPAGKIVFFGDSITAGYGLDPSQAYPALVKIPGMTMVNLGVSGNTTADGLQRLKDYFSGGEMPRLVVIALGGNDIIRGLSQETMESNLNAAVTQCATQKIPVLLCGISVPQQFGTNAVFERVAQKNHVPLLNDILQGAALHAELMQDDHIHPTAAGHKIIAEAMQEALFKHFSFSGK